MANKGVNSKTERERRDEAWPGLVEWDLGFGAEQRSEVVWRCDATRAGKLYQRSLFGTREEAEDFAMQMRSCEPDQMFNVDSIKASAVWN